MSGHLSQSSITMSGLERFQGLQVGLMSLLIPLDCLWLAASSSGIFSPVSDLERNRSRIDTLCV